MWWPKTTQQQQLVALADDLAARFAARAPQHDRDGTFPHENFADLHQSGYLALTIPREFGGGGASILEMALAQERLARGDGSTALGASMHLSILGRLGWAVLSGDAAEAGGWDRQRYAGVARAVIEEGALINSAASEPESGSPSRGGRPATTAVPDGPIGVGRSGDSRGASDSDGSDGSDDAAWFTITGRKTYTTMAPGLRFLMISVTIELPTGPEAGQFLIEAGTPGLRIEETWDTVGMRSSGSHDIVLEGLRAPATALLSRRPYASANASANASASTPANTPGSATGRVTPAPEAPVEPSSTPPPASLTSSSSSLSPAKPPPEGAGWATLIPAVYLGIATAARNAAVDFARQRKPQPLGGQSIGELPPVQRLLGEIEVSLAESRALLFGTAEAWLEAPHRRTDLVPALAAAKYVVTNRAVEVVDRAMRVIGGAGLARAHPVQRYYRDVRAGLHHPPMDDVALTTLAKAALAR